ncbi:DUF1549 domain-containing protein [Novipirellula galeiformis]|uniref:DUF1549 domain-containing protein n=1 Tax=Novipirellula galeiformis TaxID=2528004 RepID=UPI001E2A7E4D|nr:DUF1549 domain-containing protein [Novipirellula galeiformis]
MFSSAFLSARSLIHRGMQTGVWMCLTLWLSSWAFGEAPIQFVADVAPLLQQHCLRCHNDVDRSGELSFTTADDLFTSESINRLDPEASPLLERVTPLDGQASMPQDAPPLSASEIAILRDWIAAGAPWPADVTLVEPSVSDLDWWSLQTLTLPKLAMAPSTHPIDTFIDAKLDSQGLKPVGMADARTLIRRLHYDLTGLPPSPREVDAFVAESQTHPEAAYVALLDRLLDSPHFGEKWGQHWLDIARYAETHGYDKDKPRSNAWPYRDYVIRSFNDDKPYARFVQEQVAGDALFPHSADGIIGLGFLAAGPWDLIGHVEVGEGKLDGRIAKHLDRDEMATAVFNVFMSTTIQCAQCHHHKFDPIRAEEYYRLHAVFAAVDRADRVYNGLPPEQKEQQQSLATQVHSLQQEQQAIESELEHAISQRTKELDRRIEELVAMHGITQRAEFGYHSQITKVQETTKWVQLDLGERRSIAHVRVTAAYDDYNHIGAGFGFPVRYHIDVSNDERFEDESVRRILDASEQDQANPKLQMILAAVGGEPIRYVRFTATKLAPRHNDCMLALGELEALDSASGINHALQATGKALDSIEAAPRWGIDNLMDDVSYRKFDDEQAITEWMQLDAQRSEITQTLRTAEHESRLRAITQSIASLEAQLSQFPPGQLVYAATTQFARQGQFVPTGGKPRPIPFLHRGDVSSGGEPVVPALPQLWRSKASSGSIKPDASEAEMRASLARYLTDHDNPLLWRSIANRVWQWVFGQPLVSTPNDFGRMGALPTHSELLDYLAVQLRDDPKQSIKSLVRMLVTSQAYRRSSAYDEANATVDSDNALLWRFNRRRLTAEEFRDSLLSLAGVLRLDARGGPSFQDFVIEKPEHSPHYEYHLHDPQDPTSHRRSIYRFVVRSQPQPMMTALDCADPSISVPQRDESTTAIQALTQWNHRLTEAMSVHFAKRLRTESPHTLDRRIDQACRLAWGRNPSEAERAVLENLIRAEGEETFARVLLNTSQFIYVE